MHKEQGFEDVSIFKDNGGNFDFDMYAEKVFGLLNSDARNFTNANWYLQNHQLPKHAGQRILYYLKNGEMPISTAEEDLVEYKHLTLKNWRD